MAFLPLPTVKMKRLLVIALFLFAGKIALAQIADTTLWMPNGTVNALLLRDSLLYVGGDFDQVSPVVGHFVAVDSSSAIVLTPFPFVKGKINCMVRDSKGYVYVGGNFSKVGNYNCENLFRLTPQGNFDPNFIYIPNGEVFVLSIYDDTLYLGGNFSSIGGFGRGRGAAISLTMNYMTMVYSDSLLPFDPNSDGPIYAICPDTLSHQLIVGGDFLHIGGGLIANLCKLFLSTGQYVPSGNSVWTAVPQVFGPVRSIAVHRNKIYVAGDFDSFASTIRKGIGVLSPNGHLLTLDVPSGNTYDAGLNGHVRDIKFVGNKLFIGGNFSVADGHIRNNLACLDTFLNVLPWNPSADGQVYNLAPWDTTSICVGGAFHMVGADTCYYAALVELDSLGTVHHWNPKFDGAVYATLPASTGGKVWAGGDFIGAGGILCNNLVAINTNTKAPNNWRPKINYPVSTLFADSFNLFLAGDFTQINSLPRIGIASFNLSNGNLNSFNPGVNGAIRTMASSNSQLLIGGNFTNVGGQLRDNIACVDINSGTTTAWNPGCAGTVNKIIIDGDHVYVGGFFSQTGGQFRDNLARLSLATGIADWTWACNTDNGIYDMDLYNGALLIGGWFQNVSGQARTYAASVDTISGSLLPFNPFFSNYIREFERYNQDLFISGVFSTVSGNILRPNLCDYDFTNAAFDSWTPVPNSFPYTMQASQNWLYIGGSFQSVGYQYHPNLDRISINWVTGISENNLPQISGIKIFPNPTNEIVYVSLENGWRKSKTIQVMDINGQIVMEENVSSFQNIFYSLNLSELSSGIYVVRVLDNDGNESSARVVKN